MAPCRKAAFSWEVLFHHNTHTHPGPAIGPGTTGDARSGSFVVPDTGETSTDVFYRITLTVTDSGGRSTESFVDVLPRTTTLNFDATPTSAERWSADPARRPTPPDSVCRRQRRGHEAKPRRRLAATSRYDELQLLVMVGWRHGQPSDRHSRCRHDLHRGIRRRAPTPANRSSRSQHRQPAPPCRAQRHCPPPPRTTSASPR